MIEALLTILLHFAGNEPDSVRGHRNQPSGCWTESYAQSWDCESPART